MNWGNKLLLVIIIFIAGMLYLVYRTTQTSFELVENDYYKQELSYQDIIDGTKSANALSTGVVVKQNNSGIVLELPEEMKNKQLSGNVWFYCAYNAAKDKKFVLQTNKEAVQAFPLHSIDPGNYTVRIQWNDRDKKYYAERKLSVL
jgi:hypothetical protein